MSEPQKPSCVDCVHAVFEDYGYSNYTREGTDFTCKLGLHPRGTFDRFYGRDPKFAYAAECSRLRKVKTNRT